MNSIQPNQPDRLSDSDVDQSPFSCCGDERVYLLTCQRCGHIWAECIHCSTWFIDLDDLDIRTSCLMTSDDFRLSCPACEHQFNDRDYLAHEVCDRYLPTRQQVVAAGLSRLLEEPESNSAMALADRPAPSNPPARPAIRVKIPVGANRSIVMGAAIGAAGWIIGLTLVLARMEFYFEAGATALCSSGVLIVGFLLCSHASRGKLVSLFSAVQILLLASFLFGLSALAIMASRGVLESVLDPDGEFPAIWNFAAPLILLGMAGLCWIKPIRKFLLGNFV